MQQVAFRILREDRGRHALPEHGESPATKRATSRSPTRRTTSGARRSSSSSYPVSSGRSSRISARCRARWRWASASRTRTTRRWPSADATAMLGKTAASLDDVDKTLEALRQEGAQAAERATGRRRDSTLRESIALLAIVILAALIVGILSSVTTSRAVTRPLAALTRDLAGARSRRPSPQRPADRRRSAPRSTRRSAMRSTRRASGCADCLPR